MAAQIKRAGRERLHAFHVCDWLVPTTDNREFRQIRPLCKILKANTRAISKAFSKIPYATEQGIISAEQGIPGAVTGNLPAKTEIIAE